MCAAEGPFGPTAFACCGEGTECVFGFGVCCPAGTEQCFGPDGDFTACCPEGTFCNADAGACEEIRRTICPSGETAENCAADVMTDCDPNGLCGLADVVDNGCACIERACSFVPCATGADCESGLCVEVQGCCGGGSFCAIPCDTGGEGGRSPGGWQR